MNKQTSGFRAPVVGGNSLLVIFAVLCLTVFALLGLSTAQANKRLADASIQAVADYYAADSEAERILAKLRSGQSPEGIAADQSVYRYTCPVADSQTLFVEARVDGPDEWEVYRWQAVPKAQQALDESLDVWTGDSLDTHE